MTRLPLWISSQDMQQILHALVDQIDKSELKGSAVIRPVQLNSTSWPALYKSPTEAHKEELWSNLEYLAAVGWIAIQTDKKQHGQIGYELRPRVSILNCEALRSASGRGSRVKSASESWREAIATHLSSDDPIKKKMERYCIEIKGRSAVEIVQRLSLIQSLKNEDLLLREVSSRIFWGMSKVLDKRQELVCDLLDVDECPFAEMPVMLHTHTPAKFTQVLFIENIVNFDRATRDCSGKYDGTALVFSSGFKGSAKRIRQVGGASIYHSAGGDFAPETVQQFSLWLNDKLSIPSYFWGDLDYAGMDILRRLRQTFPDMCAWRPGYAPMLNTLESGGGHLPIEAGKERQKMLEECGCEYADKNLIPAIEKYGKFVDQESF